MAADFGDLREEYEVAGLREEDADPDPIVQFRRWFDDAVESGLGQPNTMTLATVSEQGSPSVRAVLLKGISSSGLDFYTNYESRKGRELAENPNAAVCFVWQELHRQVRVEGVVGRLPEADSDAYFASRPRGAQLAAAASEQSSVVASRDAMRQRYRELEGRYANAVVPRPDSWGGYRLTPTAFEFWQGQPNRFHDRLHYRATDATWEVVRLAP